jgi:hypothetical protein
MNGDSGRGGDRPVARQRELEDRADEWLEMTRGER